MSCRILKFNSLAGLLALSVISVACDGPNPPTPIPSPTPTPIELNYTISGAVTEMTEGGPMPVLGMRVTVSSSFRSALTDANGFYSIPGITTATGSVSAAKDGYITVTTPFTATADTRLDIRVERFVPYTLSGMAYEDTPSGRVPIAGVVLYCDGCGSPEGHTFVTTDEDGLYRLSWVTTSVTYLQIFGKEGYKYVGPAGTSNGVPITTVGDTRFDVQFVRQ
jgi:hypothetical protein